MRPVLLAPATIVEACPGCHRPTSDSATLGTANGFVVATPTRQFTQPPYEIRQCQRCGLMYRTPRPAETELDAYYRSDAFDNFENAELFPTERVVREILNRLPRGARVLDFGCNTGRLIASFVGHFECFGIELNPAAADVARRRGVCVTALAELASAAGTFDAVVTIDVFEHLTKPMPVLAALKDLLKRGGALIIVTANGDAPVCRTAPAEFWYFRALGHVLMLTRAFASYLATALDLRLVSWVEMSHYDVSYPAAFVQRLKSWAYWSFRRQRLRYWYPKTASRLCVSPYMPTEYWRRCAAAADVLYPSRASSSIF